MASLCSLAPSPSLRSLPPSLLSLRFTVTSPPPSRRHCFPSVSPSQSLNCHSIAISSLSASHRLRSISSQDSDTDLPSYHVLCVRFVFCFGPFQEALYEIATKRNIRKGRPHSARTLKELK